MVFIESAMHGRGFSLIELLVTIAIVGVIAAIAAPAYKSYSTRSKVLTTFPVAEQMVNLEKHYYAKKGIFATAADLGMNAGPYYSVANPSTYNKYLSEINIDWGSCSSNNRLKYSEIQMVMARGGAFALIDPGDNTVFSGRLEYVMIVSEMSSGLISTKCFYRTSAGITATLATFLPPQCQFVLSAAPGTTC